MAADTALAAGALEKPAAEAIYRHSLVRLMRAHDSFGAWERKPDDEILQSFVLTKEQRRAIPVVGDPNPKVLWRLEVFYTAVGYAVTTRTGLDATPILKISSEGFGRAILVVGRLVVLSRVLRDVHRFGFESTEAVVAAGEAMVAECLAAIDRFPAVAADVD
jgi:probable nitrogen fixation protein